MDIQQAELETLTDSHGQLGIRAWLVIETTAEGTEPTRAGTATASEAVQRVAEKEGFEGYCEIVYATPAEAERLPSRRRGAAA